MKLFSLIAVAAATETDTGDGAEDTNPCSFQASTLTCAPNSLKLTVPYCAYAASHVTVPDVHIGGDNDANKVAACVGSVYDDADVLQGEDGFDTASKVVYDITADECGITNPNTDTHIVYSGKLFAKSGSANDVISREKLIDMELMCDFSREVSVSVDQVFQPLVSSVEITMDTVTSQFGVDMELFSESTYTTALDAEHQVNVPDPIYAKISLDVTENLALQIKKCTATPTADGSGDKVYKFIDNYAALETDDMELTQNCEDKTAKFWINSFAFVTEEEATNANVYLHCEVHVCDLDNDVGGCTCDADTDGDNTDGGNTDGDNTDGDNTDGTNTDGDNTDGGNADGTNTDGDNTDGTNTDGDNTDGTNTDGGNAGGSTDGGRRRRAVPSAPKANATLRVGPISISNLQKNF